MDEVPPQSIDAFPTPNYDNPETRGPGLIILVSLFFLVAAFIVPVRCYTRWYITKSFGADDIFIMVTMIPATGLAVSFLVANIHYGRYQYVWDVPPEKIKPFIKLALAGYVLFAVASLLTKLSLYAFYLRLLSPEGSRFYRWFVWILGFLCVVYALSYIFQQCFACKPIQAAWDNAPPFYQPDYEYHCLDRFALNFYGSIINAVTDLVTMLIPAPVAWKLALPVRQRLAVIAIFGLGTAVCLAGALRIKYIADYESPSNDNPWDGYPLWILMTVEIDVGIICASAPALRPFVAKYLPRLFNSSPAQYSDPHGNNTGPHKPRPNVIPHGQPPVGSPNDVSRGNGPISDGANYIALFRSLKSAS